MQQDPTKSSRTDPKNIPFLCAYVFGGGGHSVQDLAPQITSKKTSELQENYKKDYPVTEKKTSAFEIIRI